jgi:hypothetical protein
MISSIMATDLTISEEVETSVTYKLSDQRFRGFTDGVEALQQAIYKVLNTEKYEYPIYSFSYGIELEGLTGKEPAYVKAELKRRISECLLQDDRIQSVDDFKFSLNSDNLTCEFSVVSIYGTTNMTKEVNI